jgi:hypothetical protein
MLGPLILTVLGYGLAMGPVLLKVPDLPGWLPVAVLAVAFLWGLLTVRRRRERPRHGWRLVGICAQLAVLVMHTGWYYGLAAYEPPAAVPHFGDEAPPLVATRVRDSAPFDLRAERGERVVLVFFRGAW